MSAYAARLLRLAIPMWYGYDPIRLANVAQVERPAPSLPLMSTCGDICSPTRSHQLQHTKPRRFNLKRHVNPRKKRKNRSTYVSQNWRFQGVLRLLAPHPTSPRAPPRGQESSRSRATRLRALPQHQVQPLPRHETGDPC